MLSMPLKPELRDPGVAGSVVGVCWDLPGRFTPPLLDDVEPACEEAEHADVVSASAATMAATRHRGA